MVVVADPDMLRQVMVKDFNSFPNRIVRILTCGSNVSFDGLTVADGFCLLALCAESALHLQAHD